MALLYPWATREYLLWKMSLGQIILYYNLGMALKYGKPKNDNPYSLADKSYNEIKAIRDQMIKDGLIEKKKIEEKHDVLASKYGAIE